MTREADLARTLVELADNLVADFDVVDLLTRLVDRCVELLDVDAAGIMLAAPDGTLRVVASSSEAAHLLEMDELHAAEGPCLDSYRTGRPVTSIDLGAPGVVWPAFAAVATATGFRSACALPMRLRDTVIGALNLFRATTGTLGDDDLAAGQALADVATIAVLQHRSAEDASLLAAQLTLALDTRVVIEQAKGIVAEHERLPISEAFDALRHYARRHNLRLADVAAQVIARRLPVGALRADRARPA